jgi:hypothetical protein
MDVTTTVISLLVIGTVHISAMSFVFYKGTKFYKKKKGKTLSKKTDLSLGGELHTPIWDIIHSNFDDYSVFNYSKDIYLVVFFLPIIFNLLNISFVYVYEFFWKFMILIFLRSFSIISTILPRNSKLKVKINKKTDFWTVLYHRTIGGGCYDKLFSGHASFGLLATLLLFKYNFLETNIFNISLFILLNIIHFMMIGVTRAHYTVDIIVAIYVTLWVYESNTINKILEL